jgi:phosphate:Na+ symporter
MSAPLSTLVLGLGLFFLGIQLIGMSLRQLAGESFRTLVQRTTHSRLQASLVGLVFGGIMQSATAVTFILVGLASSGLITTQEALPIIVWCNVGLTALAFVATLNIHPLVAWLVGGSGVAWGMLKRVRPRAGAGVLLGMGLILFGLETMSHGVAPLARTPWFREMLATGLGHPLALFTAGIAAAALLQSNTGASMLVITLARDGLFPLRDAALLIYGSNLGAIALRTILALGMHGRSLRLVRMEDLFCLTSGVLMLALDLLEAAGVPLVRAGVSAVTPDVRLQLALVFLLSNLLPALALTPVLGWCHRLLERLFPDRPSASPGAPRYLTPQALGDPGTASLLLERELARLIGMPVVRPERTLDGGHRPDPAFIELALAIEQFAARLAATGSLSETQAGRVQSLRGALSTIRHLEDAVGDACIALGRLGGNPAEVEVVQVVEASLNDLLHDAARIADRPTADAVAPLLERTGKHGPLLDRLRQCIDPGRPAVAGGNRLHAVALLNDVEIVVWVVHRLAKTLSILAEHPS